MSQPLRLLIVDDSQGDIDLLLHALRRGGYQEVIHEGVDTPAALRAALHPSHQWDAITSDHAMSGFSAPEALALARELRPELPFILVSSEMDIGLVVSLMTEGTQDYVLKSQLPRLAPVIRRCLREAVVRQEHVLAAEELLASEARYRRLFEACQDGILIIDPATEQITDVNEFLIEMLHYPKEEFVGKKLWEIGAFKDTEACKQAFNELQTIGYVRYEDLPLETSEGKRMDVEFVSNSYLVGRRKVIQCNIRDITERKQAEAGLRALTALLEQRVAARMGQLEALNKELESFSYSVSHDLRAPLRQVQGFAQILQEEYIEEGGPKALALIESIGTSVRRMNELIDALLKLANRTISGFTRESVDLSALVNVVAAELQQSDPTRQVEWTIAAGITVYADAQLLRIVLDNLLGNAWKFTGYRELGHIEFGVTPRADGIDTYFVRDNGAGFDMGNVDRLFGAFRRLHTNKEFPGTGIGLATVQRIVHRHGGLAWASGVVDQGATFSFTLTNEPSVCQA